MSRSAAGAATESSAAKISPETLLLQQKHKGTIGIIGLEPLKVARLNRMIVEYCNKKGLIDDQHIPEILAIALPTSGTPLKPSDTLKDQLHLCEDYGCDVIAIADDKGDSKYDEALNEKYTRKGKRIKAFMSSGGEGGDEASLKRLAAEVSEYALTIETPHKKPTAAFKDIGAGVFEKLLTNLKDNQDTREAKIVYRMTRGGYPTINSIKESVGDVVGVLGGAGPLASAILFEELVKKGVPAIHSSVNGAPGKHRFEIEGGPSYIDYYCNEMKFFKQLGLGIVTIPCNTAHKRLEEFCVEGVSVIDIRLAALNSRRYNPTLILLGTDITVGFKPHTEPGAAREKEAGIYESCRLNLAARAREEGVDFSIKNPFITPSAEQQELIMGAIYEVKAGNLRGAKDIILGVVKGLRREYGRDYGVILACTELPTPFGPIELGDHMLFDPAQSLAEAARAAVSQKLLEASSRPSSAAKPYSATPAARGGRASTASGGSSSPTAAGGRSSGSSTTASPPEAKSGSGRTY